MMDSDIPLIDHLLELGFEYKEPKPIEHVYTWKPNTLRGYLRVHKDIEPIVAKSLELRNLPHGVYTNTKSITNKMISHLIGVRGDGARIRYKGISVRIQAPVLKYEACRVFMYSTFANHETNWSMSLDESLDHLDNWTVGQTPPDISAEPFYDLL